jgi:PAS domain S-box-containing protein
MDIQRLIQILEATSDFVATTDEWGTFEYINPAGRALIGLTPSQPLNGLTAENLHTPHEYERIMSVAEPAAVEHGLWSGESTFRTLSGEEIPVSLVLVAHRTPQGEVSHYSAIARDIRKQKAAERSLRAGEERLRSAIDAGQLGIWEWDIATNEITWSEQCHRIMGFHEDDYAPRAYQKVIHPADLTALRSTVAEALENLSPVQADLRITTPSGELRWCHTRARFVLQNGRPEKLVGVLLDLSEQHRLQHELRASELAFRTLVEQSPDIIWRAGPDANILYVSPQHLAELNLTEQQIIGRTIPEIDHNPQNAQKWRTAFQKVFSGEGPQELEHAITIDGTEFWFLTHIAAEVIKNGKVHTAIGISRNITERRRETEAAREADAFRKQVLSAIDEGLVVLDLDLNCLMWNDVLERMIKVPSADVVGRNLRDVYPDLHKSPVYSLIEQALNGTPGQIPEILVRPSRMPDQALWLTFSATPLCNADGVQTGVLVQLRDITERKRLAEELAHAQRMDSVGRVASAVAHDFNNLLTAVVGFTENAGEMIGQGHPAQAVLQQILDTSERAAALTAGLLAFGKRQVVHPRPIPLNTALHEMKPLLQNLAGKAIQLNMQLAETETTVQMDPSQLEQLMTNLIVNARDALPNAGAINIRTQPNPHEPATAIDLIVEDNGEGMDEETRLHIFEPYYTTKRGGVGLGLATCYGIVQQAGGEISVESASGAGTKFTITLKRCLALTSNYGAAKETQSETEPQLLLVEDDPLVRSLAESGLKRAGYRVAAASSVSEAQHTLRTTGPIRMIITDLVLPDGTGVDVANAAQALYPGVPILFVSGHADIPASQTGAVENGEFLPKPFSTRTLVRRVQEILSGRHTPGLQPQPGTNPLP